MREFPNSIELRFLLVRTLNELQSFDFAEKHLKTILHQDFHFAEGHIELALMNEGFASSRYLLALLRYFSLHHYTGEDTELWENWMNVLFYKNDEHSIEGAPYLFSKIHFDRKMFYDTLKDNNSVTTAKKIYTQILFILQYYQKNKRLMSDLDNMYLYYFSKAEENNHLFTLIVLGVLQDTAEGQEWISQNQEKIDSFHTWDDDFSFKK